MKPRLLGAILRRLPADRGRAAIIALVLLSLCVGVSAAGTSFGFHYGWSDLRHDVFRGSGSVGRVGFFGVQSTIPLISVLDLSLAGERKANSLQFTSAGEAGHEFAGRAAWEDLAFYATVRSTLVISQAWPARIYGGAGAGVHLTTIDIQPEFPNILLFHPAYPAHGLSAAHAQDATGDFIRHAEEKGTNVSGHVLLGASIMLPGLPLTLFAETRFEQVTGEFQPQSVNAYAGLDIDLP